MQDTKTNDDLELLTLAEVAALLKRSPRTVDVWVRQGKFPRPFRLTPGSIKQWRRSKVRGWIESREARRPSPRQRHGRLAQDAAE